MSTGPIVDWTGMFSKTRRWQAAALVVSLVCLASARAESYSGVDDDDDDYGNQVGRKQGGPSLAMTYHEALQRAQAGNADYDVLAVFRQAYEQAVGDNYGAEVMNERKTNLAALLLDVANKERDPNAWSAMYREAEKLSLEVLKVFPNDDAARSNAKAARSSLQLRAKQSQQAFPEMTASAEDETAARAFLFDDEDERDQNGDDDEDDLRDQEGYDDEEEEEKVHILDDDEDDEDAPQANDAGKASANTGASASSGPPVLPRTTLCDGNTCSPLANEWLNGWGKSVAAWGEVLQALKRGRLAVVHDALLPKKAETLLALAAGIQDTSFTKLGSTDAYLHKRLHVLDQKLFPAGLVAFTTLLEGPVMKDLLGVCLHPTPVYTHTHTRMHIHIHAHVHAQVVCIQGVRTHTHLVDRSSERSALRRPSGDAISLASTGGSRASKLHWH